ncbi:acyl carrier protein [Sharpea azabuensis]|uniref:acyl carrier protein n=1 Tax=Sharpea azabuensis TaxID=322505 RepID=UPI000E907DFE|nr:acyl carrier protein [Sharpea azabuensis]HAJ15286.1 acyl carrier protein [Erysipelotrichaceae bacterium]HAV18600.1 acyl carrier protein [Erysipelotrichaceae bacterium]HBG85349.1 acyl carrier protein [Erysipelotrichaceae bacterium]HCG96581.1 acyl carrier protein [Erysipelotrichaceae bacterium]
MEETFQTVKDIIVDSLSCDEEDVTLEARLAEDLNADSLDAVELMMAIEDAFGIEVPDEAAQDMKTVKSIVVYVDEHKA